MWVRRLLVKFNPFKDEGVFSPGWLSVVGLWHVDENPPPPPPPQTKTNNLCTEKQASKNTDTIHALTHTHLYMCHNCTRAHTHTRTHTHTHVHIHTHIHTSLTCDDLSPVFLLVRGKCRGVGCSSDQSIQHQRVYRGPVIEIDGGRSALWRRGFSLTDSVWLCSFS